MNKKYLILLAILGVMYLVLLSPGLLLTITYSTLGIGGLVVFIGANAFFAALCFAPLAFSASGTSKILRLTMSFGILIMWFVTPKLFSELGVQSGMASFTAQDQTLVGKVPKASGNGVELRWLNHDTRPYAYSMFPHAVCDNLCLGLLYGGNVDWVRLMLPPTRDRATATSITYVRGTSEDCAAQLCVVYIESDNTPSDATIVTENMKIRGDMPFLFSLSNDLNLHRRVTLFRGPISQDDVMWRQTEIHAETIASPTILSSGRQGLALAKASVWRNTIDIDTTLSNAGIALLPDELLKLRQRGRFDPLTAAASARVTSFLDLESIDIAPDGRHGIRLADREISSWFDAAINTETLSPEDIALLVRILAEPRLDERPSFLNLFRSKPETRDTLMTWLFDWYLSEADPSADILASFGLALATTEFQVGQLEQYAVQYQGLLSKFPNEPRLFRALGRFGFNPVPNMREFYLRNPEENAHDILEAICLSDPIWDAQTLDLLREIISMESASLNSNPSSAIKLGLDVLYALGQRDDAVSIVNASSWSQKERLLRRLPEYRNPSEGTVREMCK